MERTHAGKAAHTLRRLTMAAMVESPTAPERGRSQGAEVLLHAALVGDSTHFTRQDGVEETWRIMQPLIDAPPPVHTYPPGSWGPAEADALTAGYGGWHDPWAAS
jgi:glucose-6-phosphate 1-dehydrogenase